MLRPTVLALAFLAAPVAAEAPKVATDIAPVHSLAARVMQGLGEPTLILPPGASPHGHAMRPSEAQALEGADVIFWVGPALTPWFARAVETLGADARVIEIADLPGLTRLPFREGARFAAHDHDENAVHGDGHSDEQENEDAHGHGEEHAGFDPHLWLDPVNAGRIALAMAEALAAADPQNADAYLANAAAALDEIDAASAAVAGRLAPHVGKPFLVFHDAYHYFEARFGMEAAGTVSLGDAAEPGAARMAALRALIAETDTTCLFTEPQLSPRLAERLAQDTGVRLGILDPLGTSVAEPGPGLYPALLLGLADGMAACLGAGG
ncbi:MAG: zinc transporter [Alphaproteobacteria bacterium HGW-Alphaproteobacteria-2]|nr:MAG: zinc transporter [Alphaproteobacteria bacterium HGW-Alphaproteobacteria-2]